MGPYSTTLGYFISVDNRGDGDGDGDGDEPVPALSHLVHFGASFSSSIDPPPSLLHPFPYTPVEDSKRVSK